MDTSPAISEEEERDRPTCSLDDHPRRLRRTIRILPRRVNLNKLLPPNPSSTDLPPLSPPPSHPLIATPPPPPPSLLKALVPSTHRLRDLLPAKTDSPRRRAVHQRPNPVNRGAGARWRRCTRSRGSRAREEREEEVRVWEGRSCSTGVGIRLCSSSSYYLLVRFRFFPLLLLYSLACRRPASPLLPLSLLCSLPLSLATSTTLINCHQSSSRLSI